MSRRNNLKVLENQPDCEDLVDQSGEVIWEVISTWITCREVFRQRWSITSLSESGTNPTWHPLWQRFMNMVMDKI